ncbi:MAG: hypothetical protein ACK5JP_03510 [Akkermansiaceae bacterium]|jgi:hypothetical protein
MTIFEILVLTALLLIYYAIVSSKSKIDPNQDVVRALENICILLKDLNQKVESLSKQENPDSYKTEKLLKDISEQLHYGESYALTTILSNHLDHIWLSVKTVEQTVEKIHLDMAVGVKIRNL